MEIKGHPGGAGIGGMPFAGQQDAASAVMGAINHSSFRQPKPVQAPKVGEKRA